MFNNTLLSKHYLFTIQILLSLIGAIISYGYAGVSHYYWLFTLSAFATLELLPSYMNFQSATSVCTQQQLREIVLRWLGGIVCALFVFSLYLNGRIFHEETALIILFILVLMLYLDCLSKPTLRAAFVFGFLFLLGLLLAYADAHIGLFTALGVAGVLFSYIDESRSVIDTKNA